MSSKTQSIGKWISKTLSDGLSKGIANIISTIFVVLFSSVSLIILGFISLQLQVQVVLPIFAVVILSLFALLGVLVPVTKIFAILKNNKKENIFRLPTKVEVQFEKEVPRIWKGVCKYSSDKASWYFPTDPDVYCTKHKLKLLLEIKRMNYKILIYSICPECKADNNKYYEADEYPPGFAIHLSGDDSDSAYSDFIKGINNRLLRQIEKAS